MNRPGPGSDGRGSESRGSNAATRGIASSSARSSLELSVGTGPWVRLLFVELLGRVYVVPSEVPSAWFSAAVREQACRVRGPEGRESITTASLVRSPEMLERLGELFRSKYGTEVWRQYFEHRSEALELDPSRAPTPPTAADRIRGEFDAVSSGYDASIARNPIERYLKDRVVALARDALTGLDPILEVGPGTGYHTVPLLAAGHTVVAVDISDRMVELLRSQATRIGKADQLATRTARLGELGSALSDLSDGYFGAAFSAFGAFDLEPEIGAAAAALARLIRPGGRLVFTSLNRPGLVPLLWEVALGRPVSAGYRLGGTVPPGGVRYPLELHLRAPAEWDRVLSHDFLRRSAIPVSVIAPPFNSDRTTRFLGTRGSGRVRRLDAWLAARPAAWVAAEWVFHAYDRRARSSSTV